MLTFRAAIKEDYQEICQLIIDKEELFLVYPKGVYPLTVEQLAVLSKKRKELTVAVLHGKIVGFANLYDFNNEKYAFIGNVIVDRQQRRYGVGKKLIAYMCKQAGEKYQLSQIRLSVFSENTIALLFYMRLGFKPYDMEERLDINARRVALIHMKKNINALDG